MTSDQQTKHMEWGDLVGVFRIESLEWSDDDHATMVNFEGLTFPLIACPDITFTWEVGMNVGLAYEHCNSLHKSEWDDIASNAADHMVIMRLKG